MDKMYWYFGVRRTRVEGTATGKTRNVERIAWGKTAHATRKECITANINYWLEHDEDPIVRGFKKPMKVDASGQFIGWIEESK